MFLFLAILKLFEQLRISVSNNAIEHWLEYFLEQRRILESQPNPLILFLSFAGYRLKN